MKLTTYNYLDISTKHITKEDADRLAELSLEEVHSSRPLPTTVCAYKYGWFLGVPEELTMADDDFREKMGLSFHLLGLMVCCSEQGIPLIRIDPDGCEHDAIHTFDW